MYGPDTYRDLIRLLQQKGYKFEEFTVETVQSRTSVFLRHDVDRSLRIAYELARLNSELEVMGTFFIMLRSPGYNLLSDWSLDYVRKISDCGQKIGFHVSIPSAPKNRRDLEEMVLQEFDFLGRYLGDLLSPVFSWHDTSPELISLGIEASFGNLTNVYGRQFFKDMPYISDSGMRRDTDSVLKALEDLEGGRCHLLVHPIYWAVGGETHAVAWARAWKHYILEREEELHSHGSFSKLFPSLSASLIDQFVDRIVDAARRNARFA